MTYRFHVLGIPHTASNKDYLACAFTQKVVNLCSMLKSRGHAVVHYGNEASQVDADEHVTVTARDAIGPPAASGSFDVNGEAYRAFYANATTEVAHRKQPHDFLLCMWGAGHRPIADAHRDMITVEPGIGYPGGHFARWKVFESYAVLHAYYGLPAVERADKCDWYDWVIPNYFRISEFTFSTEKDDYLLFLGFRSIGGEGKGIQLAYELARAVKMPLVIAGPGDPTTLPADVQRDPLITFTGFVGVEDRRNLLSRARAVLCPSLFVEPFCGVSIEAMLSGTPVISTDWGAFAENNLHGYTGYRCRTFEQFTWAARNIDRIDPKVCRAWAAGNFSMERVALMYDEFWRAVINVYEGKPGWYAENPERMNLDWLMRDFPN